MLVRGQYCQIIYLDDAEAAFKLDHYAIVLAEKLWDATPHNSISKKVHKGPFDSTIFILINKASGFHRITIKVGGLYLESGFIDILNFAPSNINTYKPGILNFNAYVSGISTDSKALLGIANTPFEGQGLKNGQTSKVVNCGQKVKVIPGVGSSPTADFCSQLMEKKRTMEFVPPSLFSGKLRLFVQALYGSVVEEDRLQVDELSRTLTIDGVSLNWNYVLTSGLYTAPDGNYWLIKAGNSGIYYRKIKFSSTAVTWISALKSKRSTLTQQKIDQIEAYIFSGASLENTEEGYIAYSSGEIPNQGLPLAYGWKFNWDGSRATEVRIDGDPANILNKRATTVHIDITFSDKLGHPLANWTIASQNVWRHYPAYQCIYIGDSLTGLSEALLPSGPMGLWAPMDSSADVYCFYDRDELRLVHLTTYGEVPTTSYDHDTTATSYCGPQGSYVFREKVDAGLTTIQTDAQGFSVASVNHTVGNIGMSNYLFIEFVSVGINPPDAWHEMGPSSGTLWSACPAITYPPFPTYTAQREYGQGYYWHEIVRAGVSDTGTSTLGIPCYDSEAVILGKKDRKHADTRLEGNVSGLYGYWCQMQAAVFYDPFRPELGVYNESGVFPTLFTPGDPPAIAGTGIPENSKDITVTAYGSSFGSKELEQQFYSWGAGVEPDDGLGDFFSVSLSFPFLNGAMNSLSTVGGASTIVLKGFSKTDDFLVNQIPVGWV
jgi:hypothetical protein